MKMCALETALRYESYYAFTSKKKYLVLKAQTIEHIAAVYQKYWFSSWKKLEVH